jgi:hypothetical protein
MRSTKRNIEQINRFEEIGVVAQVLTFALILSGKLSKATESKYISLMIIRRTNNKALAVIAVFVFTTLIMASSFILPSASASNSKVCKDNNKNVVCVHTTSGTSKLHNKITKQNDNSKQSNSDLKNNVPFELPFP